MVWGLAALRVPELRRRRGEKGERSTTLGDRGGGETSVFEMSRYALRFVVPIVLRLHASDVH